MYSFTPPSEEGLGFLQPFKTESEIFSLPSGGRVSIPKYFLLFNGWSGPPLADTYNNKPILDWNDTPVFAEIAILRLFQSHGWNGAWVDSYAHGKYRDGMRDMPPISIPSQYDDLIQNIRAKTGKRGGCWDVIVWRGEEVLFVEAKRSKKDRIQTTQDGWLDASLSLGLKADNFVLIEWKSS